MSMRKIRNLLCFFICSFHLNCPTTEEQITDRQVLLRVTQKVSSNSKHTLLCLCGHNILARIKPNTIVLSHHKILVVSVLGSVLAYTFGKGCVLLVESSEQGLVFGAKLNYESCMAKPKLTQNGEIWTATVKQPLETQNKSIILLRFLYLCTGKRKNSLLVPTVGHQWWSQNVQETAFWGIVIQGTFKHRQSVTNWFQVKST